MSMDIVLSVDTAGRLANVAEEIRRALDSAVENILIDCENVRFCILIHGPYFPKLGGCPTQYVDFKGAKEFHHLRYFIARQIQNESPKRGNGKWLQNFWIDLEDIWKNLSWTPGAHRVLVTVGDTMIKGNCLEDRFERINTWLDDVKILSQNMKMSVYSMDCIRWSDNSGWYEIKDLVYTESYKHINLPHRKFLEVTIMSICFREMGIEHYESFKGRGRTMLGRNIPAYTNIMSTLLDKFSTTEDLMDHEIIMLSLKKNSVIIHQQKMESYHKSSRRRKNISKSYSKRPPARSLHRMKLRSQNLD